MTPLVTAVARDGTPGDLAFVCNSWLKSLREAFPEMRTGDFFDLQHARIDRLLSMARLEVLHPEGKPLVIVGWALLDPGPDIVHYVHVRGEYRRQGFATRLIAGRTVTTHLTEQGQALKRKLGLRYMPHLLDGP